MKNENGITLIALIVTIIVLIILAGVSINLALGENGIITISKQAKENMELAKIEEEIALNELYTQIEAEGEISSGNISNDAIEKLTKFKETIATAIKNQGVETANDASAETMAENIGKILEVRTSDATATAKDMAEGKTAYVNGEKITGSMKNTEPISQTVSQTYNITAKTALEYTLTFDQLTEIIGISYMTTNDAGIPFYGDTTRSPKIEGNTISGYVRENDDVNESFTLTITAIGY